MSKNKKSELSVEEKFTLLVLSFQDFKDEYNIDSPLLEKLSHLHTWQQHLMIKIFVSGSKQKAVEQFPTMEKELILTSLRVLVDAVGYIKNIVTNQDKFNTLVSNLNEHDFVLDIDTRNTIINLLQNKEELTQLWEGIKTEEKLGNKDQTPISLLDNFLSICKELLDMIIKFVEEQAQKVSDFVEEIRDHISSLDFLNPTVPDSKEAKYVEYLGDQVEANE